jgi:UDP-glucose 4-epimerase
MEILVTGCNGYIGAYVTKELSQRGHNVFGLDFKKGHKIDNYSKKVWDSDIRHPQDWQNSLKEKNWDAICHLAALISVGESVAKPTDYYQTNWGGTVNLLENLKYKHFIFASTGAASEASSPYGISKIAAEHSVAELAQNRTILRFYNVVGEEEFTMTNPDGLFMQLKKAQKTGSFTIFGGDYPNTKDGTAVRDYIHVKDIANAIGNCVDSEAANTAFECLGYGESTTVREFVQAFIKANHADFQVKIGAKREGDVEISEVPFVSKYMEKNYSIEDLVKNV